MSTMNLIRHRLVSMRNRARDLQICLRRWSLYDDSVSRETREDLLARLTPAEETTFESDLELTKTRLRPVSVQLRTVAKWYDFVLESINEQLERARALLDQGRHQECVAILNDVEARMLTPNEDTMAYVFRSFAQHTSHEYHQKLASIDALIRDLYLPTMKLAHGRGAVSKELLSQTPLAYLTDGPEAVYTWRQHAQHALNFGRRLPVSMLGVPRKFLCQPWNLIAIAHEVGLCIYSHLELSWEIANKLQTESMAAGVPSQTGSLWARWHETVFADIFGVLKLGPAYVSGMIELLAMDPQTAVALTPNAPVPPAYIRWHVMLQALQLMQFGEQARELFNQIHILCGDPNHLAQRLGGIYLQLVNDCRAIAGLVAFSPCQRLGGARVIDVAQPFMAAEWQNANRVKDLLLAGDESCASDENFTWAEPISHTPVPTHVALAGLRSAFETTADYEASRRMWVRFWCLMQFLTGTIEPTREREDREFAPGDATLRQIAQHAMPVVSPVIGAPRQMVTARA